MKWQRRTPHADYGTIEDKMAEYGDWNKKTATLSDKSAIYGNPYLKILRRQLEEYIAHELGPEYLAKAKNKSELKRINKEISDLGRRLDELQIRKTELENSLNK